MGRTLITNLPNNQNIREKNYLLQSPNVIIKFRLLLCNWCTIFMVYPMIIMVFFGFFQHQFDWKEDACCCDKAAMFWYHTMVPMVPWYQICWYHPVPLYITSIR